MTSEWKETTLEDCTSLLGDGLHGTPQYTQNGEYAFVNGNNLVNGRIIIKSDTKRVNRTQFEKYKKELCDRTIMVSINGTLGNVALYNGEKIILGKSACYFNVLESVDKDFIRYVVSSPSFRTYLETNATGTTIKNISLKQMRDYSFYIPGYETQKRISGILRFIDDRISLNTAINENLEQQIQTILLDLIKSDSQKDSIENVKLGDYLYIKGRIGWKGLKKDEYLESSDYRIINGESLTKDGIDWGKAGYISAERYDESPEIMLQIGDILLSKDGTIGKIGYIDRLDSPSTVASGIFVIRNIKPDIISTQFIYYLLKSKLFTAFIASRTEGSVIPHLYQKDFMEFMIPLPNAAEMNQFDSLTLPLFSTIVKNLRENEFLAATRDVLLPKLMKGEIDVSEIKI